MKPSITIIGAGVSGLASAYWLSQAGYEVILFEATSQAGGAIRSERREGFLIEHGPNSLLDTTPVLRELFEGIGRSDSLIEANPAAKNRYILRDSKLHALPMSPPAFLKTSLFSGRAKLRLLKEPFIGRADKEETLAEFVRRRLGQEFLEYAIDPFVAGVFAGDPAQLSVQAAFGKLYALEENYGSLIRGTIRGARERKKRGETSRQSARMLSFKEGLGTLIEGLVEHLGERVHLGQRLIGLECRQDGFALWFEKGKNHVTPRLLLTVPAYQLADLIEATDAELATQLRRIAYPPVSVVFFGYRQLDYPLDGFGFLVPSKEERRILGTLWSSAIFPDRAPEGGAALTTFIGGTRQPEIARQPSEQLVAIVREELASIMGITAPPDFVWVKQWSHAIPQYNLGHLQILDAVEAFEARHPGIQLSGNFRGGISVSDCIRQAAELTGS